MATLLPASFVAVLVFWRWGIKRGRALAAKTAAKVSSSGGQPIAKKKRTVSFMEEPIAIPPVARNPVQKRSYSDGALEPQPLPQAKTRNRARSLQPTESRTSSINKTGNLPALPMPEMDSDSQSDCMPAYLTVLKGNDDPMSCVVLEEIYESIDPVEPPKIGASVKKTKLCRQKGNALARSNTWTSSAIKPATRHEKDVFNFLDEQISDSDSDEEFTYVAAHDIHSPNFLALKEITVPIDSNTDTEDSEDGEAESAVATPEAVEDFEEGQEEEGKEEEEGNVEVCTQQEIEKEEGKIYTGPEVCTKKPEECKEEGAGPEVRMQELEKEEGAGPMQKLEKEEGKVYAEVRRLEKVCKETAI